MRIISGIINIVIGIGAIMFGSVGLQQYFGGAEAELAQLENLLNNGRQTIAVVDSVYKETKIKGIKMYSSKYFYSVDDKKYEGNFSFGSPAELESFITIHYQPDNPGESEAYLQKQIEKVKARSNSNFNLIIGIGAVLLGLFFIYFRGIRRILAKPEAQQHSLK